MVVEVASASDTSGGQSIVLESEDGLKFNISIDAAKGSQHLQHFIESCNPSEVFPIKVVKGVILEKVIEYLNHTKNQQLPQIPKPLPAKSFRDLITDWEFKFTSQELSTIFELLLAANYMDIPGLLDLCCAKVASEIRGKSVDEVRTMFQIENDFTPEEEERIREENRWVEPE